MQRTALLLLMLVAGRAEAKPARIVSLNPCLDATLVRLVEPERIAGVSRWSHDPAGTAIPLGLARRFRAVGGTAEEVLAARPDLVLASKHSSPATVSALRRLGVPVVLFGVPNDLPAVRAEVRGVAAAAGEQPGGEALVEAIDRAVRTAAVPGPPLPALLYLGGGLTAGAGTLPDAMMAAAGLANAARGYGLRGWGVVPLESVVRAPPRLLLPSDRPDRRAGHPALGSVAATRVPFAPRLVQCGGPVVIEAMAALARARRAAVR